jgi:hypothetical protein
MRMRMVLGICFVLCRCSAFTPAPEEPEKAPVTQTPAEEATQTASEPALDPALKKRILVLPFVNRSEFQDDSFVRVALFDTQQAVANNQTLLLIKDSELENPDALYSAGGEYHFKKVFEQAKRAAATGVITGRIEEISISEEGDETGVLGAKQRLATARVHFQLFDVATEKEVFSRTATAEVRQERVPWLEIRGPNSDPEEGKEAVSRALKKVLDRFPVIARKLAWVGRIARVDLNRFYINGGDQTGLRSGQYLRVFDSGEPVTDVSTGATMGISPGRFKGLLKVTQTFGPDSAVAVLYTGAGFRENDRVEIHNPDGT